MRYGQREPRGGLGVTPAELAEAVEAVGRALAGGAPDLTARRFLDELDAAPGAREALLARVEISSANSADVVAARDLAGIAHVDDEPAPSIAGGNQGLALRAGRGARRGRAAELARRADRLGRRRRARRAAGDELDADACVVAVPGRRAGPDRLRAGAAGAARRGARGACATATRPSCSCRCAVPAPPSAVMSVPERYWTWTATGDGDRAAAGRERFAGSPGRARAARRGRRPASAGSARSSACAPTSSSTPTARCCPPGPTTRGPAPPTPPRRRAELAELSRAPGRPAGLRRRAPGRRLRRADGGRDPQRPGRGARAAPLARLFRPLSRGMPHVRDHVADDHHPGHRVEDHLRRLREVVLDRLEGPPRAAAGGLRRSRPRPHRHPDCESESAIASARSFGMPRPASDDSMFDLFWRISTVPSTARPRLDAEVAQRLEDAGGLAVARCAAPG